MTYPLWFQSIAGDEEPRRGRVFHRSATDRETAPLPLADRYALLVERIHGDDVAAFNELVTHVLDEALRVAVYVVDNRDTAKDIVQDALIRLWDRRATLDAGRPIVPYLLAIVRNLGLDARKADRVRERYREEMRHVLPEASGAGDDERVMTTAFDDAMAALPERQRMAVRLRYQEQMAFAEIGTVLGVSANAAHQLTLRGVRALRERLGIATS